MNFFAIVRRTLVLWLLPAAAFAAGAFQPGDEPKVSYSGVREIVSSQGTVSMKEYYAPQKQRMEMSGPTGDVVLINRRDKNSTWMIMPGMKMYMDIPSKQFQQQTGSHARVVENQKVGSETLDGHKVDKYKSIVEDDEGVRGEGYYWITRDGIVLKMEVDLIQGGKKEHMVMQLKQLKVAAQSASLFELPAGYSAMPAMDKNMWSSMMNSGAAASAEENQPQPEKEDELDMPGIESVLEDAADVKSLLKKLF